MTKILKILLLCLSIAGTCHAAAPSFTGQNSQRTNEVGSHSLVGTNLQEWTEPFQRVFIRIPSSACGTQGVAATLLMPRETRYTNGAPVIINVPGGVQAGSARGRTEYVGNGFVELHFAFPGGGFADERSGGVYDFRGPNCVRALADVILFATGRSKSLDSRFISGIVTTGVVLTNNVGLAGTGQGGNVCVAAMARHGTEFPELAWYVSMESPFGASAASVVGNRSEIGVIPVYDPSTGEMDLSKLAWSPELAPGCFNPSVTNGTKNGKSRDPKGGFYLDLKQDHKFSGPGDIPLSCVVADAGTGRKAWYSPRILIEAERRNLFPRSRPDHLPTVEESREFWSWRDGVSSIPGCVRNCRNLAVIVYGSVEDHAQADPSHTHILEQVEGFRKAGAKFIRLNPDHAYLTHVSWRARRYDSGRPLVDNPAGKKWVRGDLEAGLEPSELPASTYMQAAACELADRMQAGNWSPDLLAALFENAPRAPFPWFGRSLQPGSGEPGSWRSVEESSQPGKPVR